MPLDYRRPAGQTLHIAVIRQKASGTPEGSLIVNPGGPGASGVDFVAEAGDVFDPALAARLKTVYSAGDTADPMALYRAFRGREPAIDALLAQRGLNP